MTEITCPECQGLGFHCEVCLDKCPVCNGTKVVESAEIKVLVCGGRNYDDKEVVFSFLDRFEQNEGTITCVIEGGSPGADKLAASWANYRAVRLDTHPAEWEKYGRAAGPIRNAEMLEAKPDFVIAFPGGHGTENMVKLATEAGIPVFRAPNVQPWQTTTLPQNPSREN